MTNEKLFRSWIYNIVHNCVMGKFLAHIKFYIKVRNYLKQNKSNYELFNKGVEIFNLDYENYVHYLYPRFLFSVYHKKRKVKRNVVIVKLHIGNIEVKRFYTSKKKLITKRRYRARLNIPINNYTRMINLNSYRGITRY